MLIVDWGGDYVSSTQDLQGKNSFSDNTDIDADGDTTADDSIGGRLFDESTAMNPTSGYSGTSGTFYGGAITAHQNSIDTAGFGEFAIQNQGGNDGLHVHLSEHGHSHDMHMVMYWDQADFLGGGNNHTVTFDETSSVSIDIGEGGVENLGGAQVRLLVRDESGDYWLSQSVFDSPNSSDNNIFTWDGFSGISDGNWASYDPTSAFPKTPGPGTSSAGSDLRFEQGSALFSEKNFSSITAVGYYFEQDTFHNNIDFHVEGFSVNAAVAGVPEPSSVTLLGVTALSLLGYCRRNRKLHRGS